MNPMFLAYSPPQMLPTITMNPTTSAATAAATAKVKRGAVEEEYVLPLNKDAKHIKRHGEVAPLMHRIDVNMVWWAGVGMTMFGAAAYLM